MNKKNFVSKLNGKLFIKRMSNSGSALNIIAKFLIHKKNLIFFKNYRKSFHLPKIKIERVSIAKNF